ncbi:formate dehydrogenase accessory sulfurtransferase FdhD [Aneurinibacillus terranovensis]|uniref:formate dehydrogenase accessory sulfurtransferase FdhD n=1 Tax=Aneurinibacillus terranovensis TaxID=278991 RepID=UPI00041D6BDA|nr:formate dehydrogenase accessory sulfurtransferase FdhD [Aneurinibacillus terranovensis]
MEQPITKKRKIVHYERKALFEKEDTIVTEHPVTIKINEEEFATLVCTPEYIEDMAIGFMASEGVISRFEDIEDIWVQKNEGFVHVKTKKMNPLYQQLHNKRYITSCCGNSRAGFVFLNDARTAKRIDGIHVTLSFDDCFRLINEMQSKAAIFSITGGVHNAALCNQHSILLSRMDIGRHNALDKIYGYCLKNSITITDKIVVFSGRISSEILLKVAKIGCEIILSKSAPTALALELAEDLGITTVGFIRDGSCNVYTHPQRIDECRNKDGQMLTAGLNV